MPQSRKGSAESAKRSSLPGDHERDKDNEIDRNRDTTAETTNSDAFTLPPITQNKSHASHQTPPHTPPNGSLRTDNAYTDNTYTDHLPPVTQNSSAHNADHNNPSSSIQTQNQTQNQNQNQNQSYLQSQGATQSFAQSQMHSRSMRQSDGGVAVIRRSYVQQQQARPTGLISASANAGILGIATGAPSSNQQNSSTNQPNSSSNQQNSSSNQKHPETPSSARRKKLPAIQGDSNSAGIKEQRGKDVSGNEGVVFSEGGAMVPADLQGDGASALPVEIQIPAEQRLAMEILIDGYVQAYVDFFYLVHAQRSMEAANSAVAGDKSMQQIGEQQIGDVAGDAMAAENPDAPKPLPALSVEDLIFLRRNLTDAEKARRRGDAIKVYEAFKNLADFFDGRNDFKTAVQFHHKCLEIAREMDNIAAEGQANQALGRTHERHKEVSAAIVFFEECLLLARKEQSGTREKEALRHLVAAYRRKAEECEGMGEYGEAVTLLRKCADVAHALDDLAAEGTATYRLGLAHEQLKDTARALQHFEHYYSTTMQLRDEMGQAAACAALARVCTALQDEPKAVMYLELLLDLGQRTNQVAFQAEACGSLGVLFSKQGDHAQAVAHFEKYFEIARSMETRTNLDTARIHLGVARANARIGPYLNVVLRDLKALLAWKNTRQSFEPK